MTNDLPYSQACENNKAPILERLQQVFVAPGKVLEIGTLTGQHAVHFAKAMPHLQWQPSDHPESAHLCRDRLAQATFPNILPVVELDVSDANWPAESFQWAFSANTAHIMAWPEVEKMFHGIGERLLEDGAFCLYGPFNHQGEYTSDSNRRFDQNLKTQAPHMGIRDLADLSTLAESAGMRLMENHPMPANNELLVFRSGSS